MCPRVTSAPHLHPRPCPASLQCDRHRASTSPHVRVGTDNVPTLPGCRSRASARQCGDQRCQNQQNYLLSEGRTHGPPEVPPSLGSPRDGSSHRLSSRAGTDFQENSTTWLPLVALAPSVRSTRQRGNTTIGGSTSPVRCGETTRVSLGPMECKEPGRNNLYRLRRIFVCPQGAERGA